MGDIFPNIYKTKMDIATDMDALKNLKNLNNSFNILRESFLDSLLIKKQRLIKLRDEHMIFSAHVRIKSLDEDITFLQNIINGKCCF